MYYNLVVTISNVHSTWNFLMNVISLIDNFLIYILPYFLTKPVLKAHIFQRLPYHCKYSFGKEVISSWKDYVLNTTTKNTFYNRNIKLFLGKLEHIKAIKTNVHSSNLAVYLWGTFIMYLVLTIKDWQVTVHWNGHI